MPHRENALADRSLVTLEPRADRAGRDVCGGPERAFNDAGRVDGPTMPTLQVQAVATFEEFVRAWRSDEIESGDGSEDIHFDETEMRLRWQLLGQLNRDEVLVRIPEWLADEKAGSVDGAPPTEVVGHIGRETEKAIRLDEAASARPLLKLAHRIHELEQNGERTEWLDNRLAEHRQAFDDRDGIPTLADGWLPKSQLEQVVRHTD